MEVVKEAPAGWTTYIDWEKEAVFSMTAKKHNISNLPTPEHVKNMVSVAEKVFLPIRVYFGEPVRVNSFYRSEALNPLIAGASKTSQHMVGEAIDLSKTAKSRFTNKDLFDFVRKNLEFDQLIWEYGTTKEPQWVHVSFKRSGENRKQIIYKL